MFEKSVCFVLIIQKNKPHSGRAYVKRLSTMAWKRHTCNDLANWSRNCFSN